MMAQTQRASSEQMLAGEKQQLEEHDADDEERQWAMTEEHDQAEYDDLVSEKDDWAEQQYASQLDEEDDDGGLLDLD